MFHLRIIRCMFCFCFCFCGRIVFLCSWKCCYVLFASACCQVNSVLFHSRAKTCSNHTATKPTQFERNGINQQQKQKLPSEPNIDFIYQVISNTRASSTYCVRWFYDSNVFNIFFYGIFSQVLCARCFLYRKKVPANLCVYAWWFVVGFVAVACSRRFHRLRPILEITSSRKSKCVHFGLLISISNILQQYIVQLKSICNIALEVRFCLLFHYVTECVLFCDEVRLYLPLHTSNMVKA